MTSTRLNLDLQSDLKLTDSRLQGKITLQDAGAVRKITLEWEEPSGADRTITYPDPGRDAQVAFKHEIQAGQSWKEVLLTADQLDSVNDGFQAAGAFALVGLPSDGETLIVRNDSAGADTFVFKAAAAAPFEVQIGGDVPTTLANLATQIGIDSTIWAAASHLDLASIATDVVVFRKLIPDAGTFNDRLHGSTVNGRFVDYGTAPDDVDYANTALTALSAGDPSTRNFGIERQTLEPGEQHLMLAEDSQYSWDADAGNWHQIGTVPATSTSAPGGGVQGTMSVDEDLGLEIVGGVARVKVDGATVLINGLGQLESAGGGGGGGATTALASYGLPFTRDSAATPPTPGTTGTDTDTLDHPDGSTTGQRFEFTVPDDYVSGDITIAANFRMAVGVASPNNQIRVNGQVEVHDHTSGLSTLLSANNVDVLVPDGTTDIDRVALFTVPAASVDPGNVLEVFVEREGGHGSDLAADVWKVIAYEVIYTSGIANRAFTHTPQFLRATDEPSPTPVTIGTDTDAEEYDPSTDNEQKFSFTVPENWDGFTGPTVRVVYKMAGAAAGTVRLATEGEIADATGGSIVALGIVNFDFTPPNDVLNHRTALIRELIPANLHPGDLVTLKLARRATVDTHTQGFQLIAVSINWAGIAIGGFTTVALEEKYLELGIFGNNTETGVSGDTAIPDFTGDFEILDRMISEIGSGRIDAYYPGRLAAAQTRLSQLRIGLLGIGATPQYRLKIYVEAAAPPHTMVYDSGLQAAPGALAETLLVAPGDIPTQPVGSKRYHVVVEAYLNSGDELHVARPFVRQE